MSTRITINRAPVLTLWAAVVAERLGHDRAAALTLGKAVAGLNAQSKGRRLGIYHAPAETGDGAKTRAAGPAAHTVALLHREVPVSRTRDGLRALERGRRSDPAAVARYLESKFGEALADVRSAMSALARAFPKAVLAERAFALYEAFRPGIPAGTRGWGAAGVLDLARLRGLAPSRAAGRAPAARPAKPGAAPGRTRKSAATRPKRKAPARP